MSETERLIPCAEAVRQLWEYLDRALPAGDHARVERHLAFCRRCCGELEFARELRALLASHASDGIPAEVRAELEAFVEGLE